MIASEKFSLYSTFWSVVLLGSIDAFWQADLLVNLFKTETF